MKNLLSLLAALGLTATAATTVIACGSPKNSVVIKKTALKDLNLKTRLKNSVKNQQAAFDSFIELNPEVSDLRDSVQVIAFDAPDYNQEGLLEVQAKTNTKYSGTLTITIPELNKTDIARLVTNTTIQGIENMTADQAFQAVLTANSSWTNLSDYVDFNDDEYAAPSSTSNGSLTITAKSTSEFSGSLTITISKLIDLNTLNLTAITGIENMNDTDAFNAFLANQDQNLSNDFSANVTYTLVKPGYGTPGSLTITAQPNTEYTGLVEVTINAIGQTSLDSLGLTTSLSIPATNQQAAFDLFIEMNPEVSDLRDNLEITSFSAPQNNQTGLLTVAAKVDAKYTGNITITIPELNKTNLEMLINNRTIEGIALMTVQEAFQAFLTANSSFIGLENFVDYDVDSFVAPSSVAGGSLTVTAKPNTAYTGTLTVTITQLTNAVDEHNFVDVVKQISENNQLVLHIPSGTNKGSGYADSTYARALKQSFIDLVLSLSYQINLQDMVVTQQWFNGSNGYEGEAPNDTQLNSDYYEWHTTKGISIGGHMITASGATVPFEFHFLQCEIIIGQQ